MSACAGKGARERDKGMYVYCVVKSLSARFALPMIRLAHMCFFSFFHVINEHLTSKCLRPQPHGWGGTLQIDSFQNVLYNSGGECRQSAVIIQIAFSFMRNATTHAQIKDMIGLYTQQLIDFYFFFCVFFFVSNPELNEEET